MPKALKALDLVGNHGNKSNYISKDQSEQIKKALKDKLNEVCRKFDAGTKNKSSFELK